MSYPGNIYLVGLMGAGKTTVGKLIAKRLGKSFLDADQEMERRTGVKIPVIFEIEGEAGFRDREAAVLAELTQIPDLVLATGGGAVLRPENRSNLKANGTVIYLRAHPSELWVRTRNDKNRPLLQTANPQGRLQELYLQRDPLYREAAHLIVDTGKQSPALLATQLEVKLGELCKPST